MKRLAWTGLIALVVGGSMAMDVTAAEVKVEIDEKDCKAGFTSGAATVTFSKQDVLVFNFANHCAKNQEVAVCVRKPTGTTFGEPWFHCSGPPPAATIGRHFAIGAKTAKVAGTAQALCTVRWPDSAGSFKAQKFCLQVFNGAETEHVTCPRVEERDCPSRGSELAIDVVP